MIGYFLLGVLFVLAGRVVFWAERQRWEERYQGGHRAPTSPRLTDRLERWLSR